MYWSKLVSSISPYIPGEQPTQKLIKLNTNENPYPPSPATLSAIEGALNDALRLYPDPECRDLRSAIAAVHGLNADQVFAGNGSDEVLAFCFLAFCDPDRAVRFADITYSFYPVYASLFGIPTQLIPLNEDFTLPTQAFCSGSGPVIIANPNAPTSLSLSLAQIEEILLANKSDVVIIDEAYAAFSGTSAASLIDRYENLLIVRTFSKSHSLAGLRIGYALGHPHLIEALSRVKNSFNSYPLDRVALAAAKAAILDQEYYQNTTEKIIATREQAILRLRQMGFHVFDSRTNFIFASHPQYDAADLMQQLRQRGILVRHFTAPRIANYLRITIGLDEEMDALYEALTQILAGA